MSISDFLGIRFLFRSISRDSFWDAPLLKYILVVCKANCHKFISEALPDNNHTTSVNDGWNNFTPHLNLKENFPGKPIHCTRFALISVFKATMLCSETAISEKWTYITLSCTIYCWRMLPRAKSFLHTIFRFWYE